MHIQFFCNQLQNNFKPTIQPLEVIPLSHPLIKTISLYIYFACSILSLLSIKSLKNLSQVWFEPASTKTIDLTIDALIAMRVNSLLRENQKAGKNLPTLSELYCYKSFKEFRYTSWNWLNLNLSRFNGWCSWTVSYLWYITHWIWIDSDWASSSWCG